MNLYYYFHDSKFMRSECLTSKMVYERPLPIYRLISAVADRKYMYLHMFIYVYMWEKTVWRKESKRVQSGLNVIS